MKIDRWFWLIPTNERPPKDGPETNRRNNPEKPIRCIRAHVYSLSSSPPSRCASTLLPELSRPSRRFNNLGCYLFFRHRNLIECASESGLHTPSTFLSSFYLTTREMCHLRIRRRAVVTSLTVIPSSETRFLRCFLRLGLILYRVERCTREEMRRKSTLSGLIHPTVNLGHDKTIRNSFYGVGRLFLTSVDLCASGAWMDGLFTFVYAFMATVELRFSHLRLFPRRRAGKSLERN